MSTKNSLTPIVAIGASAGGIEAIHSFVSALPAKLGYALIINMHHLQNQKSILNEVIASWTSLPVLNAKEDMVIKSGCIYLAKPGYFLSVHHCKLHLTQKDLSIHNQHTIDFLFRSLAADQKEQAIGIVLSGMLDDGALGLQFIKESGGLGIAQVPESAEFNSMPFAAIDAGGADLVLAPENMPKAIADYWAQMHRDKDVDDCSLEAENQALTNILDVLNGAENKNFHAYKKNTLKRRIERRMRLLGEIDLALYADRLKNDRKEVRQLIKDLLIGVTAFFRDPEAYRQLDEKVIPALFEGKRPSDQVRVWVAGCSTGQEAYSLAILLFEYQRRTHCENLIQVFATDINESALDIARGGLYSNSEVEGLSEELLQRYFTIVHSGFVIAKNIRESVVFATHNLLSDPPFPHLDLIVCRNVFIYIEASMQAKLLKIFSFSLKNNGFLFLGTSEAIGIQAECFKVVSKPWRIFQHIVSDKPKRDTDISVWNDLRKMRPNQTKQVENWALPSNDERIFRNLFNSFGPAFVVSNEHYEVLYTQGNTSLFLRIAKGKPSNNLVDMLQPVAMTLARSVINKLKKVGERNIALGIPDEDGMSMLVSACLQDTPELGRIFLLWFDFEHSDNLVSLAGIGENTFLIQQLEQELKVTRDDLSRTIHHVMVSSEEQKAVNEEITAMNEELQAANEELESSKEELQSLNEELQLANNTLDEKVHDLTQLNNDLNNFQTCLDIPTLFLDNNYCINRYTPATEKLLRLIPSDLGRPITDITHSFIDVNLLANAQQVLASGQLFEQEIRDLSKHYFIQRTLPYTTNTGKIEGVVITFTDITVIKKAQEKIQEYWDQLQEQQDLLDSAQIHILARDLNEHIIFWNKGAEKLYGWSKEEVLGKISHEVLRTEFPLPLKKINALFLKNGEWVGELKQFTKAGEAVFIHSYWRQVFDVDGKPRATVVVNNNISEYKKTQQKLKQTEQQLTRSEAIFHNTSEGVIITDDRGTILSVNKAYCTITGYSEYDAIGKNPSFMQSGKHDKLFYSQLWTDLKRNGNWEGEIWNLRKNGEIYPEWLSITSIKNSKGETINYIGVFSDISDAKASARQLDYFKNYDALTNLPNRVFFHDRVKREINLSTRNNKQCAVLFLNLDRFKEINDSYGHVIGNEILIAVAARFKKRLRQQDTLASLSGDEFAIILENIDAIKTVERVAKELLTLLSEPFTTASTEKLYVSASIGISVFPKDAVEAADLIQKADSAMHRAKESGRNNYCFYNHDFTLLASKRLRMETALRKALKNEEFVVYYQPQIDLISNLVIGCEALVRWQPPEKALIPPSEFIPLAEETGLIVSLGEWILRTACAQAKAWQNKGFMPITMAVNLSPLQFSDIDLESKIVQTLSETGLSGEYLELELTESVLLEQSLQAEDLLNSLKQQQIKFAIDDFGTGYSSLAYLKRFPIDKLKIDQSFIAEIPKDKNDMVIATAIIALANKLGLKVLAEGAELQEHIDFLRQEKCDSYQGYYFSRPVPAQEFEQFLTKIELPSAS